MGCFLITKEPKKLKLLFKISSELASFSICTSNYSTGSTAKTQT